MKNHIKFFLLIPLLFLTFGCSILQTKEDLQKEKEKAMEVESPKEIEEEEPDFVVEAPTDNPNWPVNEYTSVVPVFTYGINEKVYTNNEDGFIYGAEDVTIDEYNQYKKEIRRAGFRKNVVEETGEITTYTAKKDIYEILLSYADNAITITVIKESQGS